MKTFKELGLNPHIQTSLEELGYIEATPIQEQAIPFILENERDLIGLAQTGTGKTAAYGLPILDKIRPSKELQAIILCPTRELCLQISREMAGFAKNSPHAAIAAVYGGARMETQIREIRAGANIVVGTPGRVHDMIRRNILKMQTIRFVVLDEADEMLDLGFKDDLDAILADTPETKQTLLFSATMSASVYAIAKEYMKKPKEISVGKKNIGADKVEHHYYLVKPGQKYEALRRIVDSEPDIYGILFCRTRNETQEIADKLMEHRYSAEALHGDIKQSMRTQIMDRFRQRKIQLLVATDVAARGIDVNDLTHIINYSLPDVDEVYVHRSGRTGRASKSGVSISILTMRELRKIKFLEQKTGKAFEQKFVPSGRDICERQLISLVEKMKDVEVDKKEIAPFLPTVEAMLKGISRQELVARFVSAEFNHYLNAYKDAKDFEIVTAGKMNAGGNRERSERGEQRRSAESFVDVRLNIGKKDHLDIKTLFGLVNSQRELKGAEIGKIKLFDGHVIFGIDKIKEAAIAKSFKSTRFRGRAIEARLADSAESRESEKLYSGPKRGRKEKRQPKGKSGRYKSRY